MLASYWAEFLALYTINFLNLISPGAGCVLTLRNSTVYDRKTGIVTGFGIVASSVLHKTYTLLGFGLVVSQSDLLFNVIKFSGCFYLIYLGFQSWRHSSLPFKLNLIDVKPSKKPLTTTQAFKMGFLTDLLNPQASLCFISIVSATISPQTPLKLQFFYGLFSLIL